MLVVTEAPLDAAAVADALLAQGGPEALRQVTIRAVGGSALVEAQLAPATGRSWAGVVPAFDADAAGRPFTDRVLAWAAQTGVPATAAVPPGAKDWSAAWAQDRSHAGAVLRAALDRPQPGLATSPVAAPERE